MAAWVIAVSGAGPAQWNIRRQAEQGDARAQFDLRVMYGTETDVVKDAAEAVRWLRLAAKHGHTNAQSIVGLMYRDGDWRERVDVYG